MKLKFPSTVVILLVIILLAAVCTWIIPGGDYVETTDENGNAVLDENSFVYVEHNAFKLWNLPNTVISAVASSLSVILICAMGNCLVVMANSKGTFNTLIAWICKRFTGREDKLIIVFIIFFALLGFVVPPQCFIGFTETMVILCISIGYDAIVGLSVVMLSVACSAMSGPINSITAIAQAVVGLPIYSGILVRFIAFAVFLILTIVYVLAYGKKIKADRTKSYMYNSEANHEYEGSGENARSLNGLDKVIFILVIAVFGAIAVGSMLYNWSTDQVSAAMLVGTVIIGLVFRYSLDEIFKYIVSGVRELTGMYAVIVMANTVGIILKSSKILDTIIHSVSGILNGLPGAVIPMGVMIFICLMNVILPSGAGKAVMMMPIITPIGQFVGMSAQTSVLAYTMGDGFSNYIIPHDASVISYLNAAKVPYPVWLKFMTKLFLIWCAAGAVILTALYYLGYGPF